MKIKTALVILAALTGTSCFAQGEKLPMDLPVYPGSETAMEVNMSNEDILPMAKAMLPMLSGKLSSTLDKIDMNDIADIIKDVKQIEFVQLDIADQKVTEKDIIGFYTKNIPGGEWTRVFWQNAPKVGTVALYTQKDIQNIYGFRTRTIVVDDKSVKRVEVAKITGRIDYVKLLLTASKLGLGKA
ncbi:hypothetical protein LLG46_09760 [bacterium]|nr:hypothetical protein [bacterium]